MGASLVVRHHPWADRKTIQAWVADCSSRDAHENGHLYSGYWNMKHGGIAFDESKVFASTTEAERHIGDVNDKHGGLTAVPAMLHKMLTQAQAMGDARYKALWDELLSVQRSMQHQNSTILARAKAGKSAFKACPHCASKVSVKFLKSVACPVCDKLLLRTPTDDKQLEAMKKREAGLGDKLKVRHAALLKKHFKPGDLQTKVWVVGGWCAS